MTIAEFSQKSHEPLDFTLDSAIQDMVLWRSKKCSSAEPIPNEMWNKMFALLKKFPEQTVCAALGVTRMQLQRKLDEHRSPAAMSTKGNETPRMDFCEAKETQPPLYKAARIPSTNTLVVEFCRADGRIMKIHTTTDSFAELMKAFFGGG